MMLRQEGIVIEIIYPERNDIKIISRIATLNSRGTLYWHRNIEICRLINQKRNFLIDGELICAEPGDIIVISECTLHQFLEGGEDGKIRICQFPLNLLLNMDERILPIRTHIRNEELSADPEFNNFIETIFNLLEKEGKVRDADKNCFSRSLAVTLYLTLMKKFPNKNASLHLNKGERKKFYDVIDYVNNCFTDNITVQNIAKAMFMSRTGVSKLFERYSGISLKMYINMLRVNRANELLNNGCEITHAALESGFQSIRTFNCVYKSIMNMTPSQYSKDSHKEILSI